MKNLLKITFTLIFTTILLLGFAMPLNPVGNWYQQFMPNLGGRQITDITFTDSLNGFAITNEVSDSSFVLRTTNGGDNWDITHFDNGVCSYYSVQFINQNTGFVSGYIYNGSFYRLVKTTNGGNTWFYINHLSDIVAIDMYAINEDTIWVVDSGSLTGGVYRTTNGGANWEQQLNLGSQNPNHIYMYNARIGFISNNTGTYLRKTTNSGLNWNIVFNKGFSDIFFVDSLKGWSAFDSVRMTTNGGANWQTQVLPYGIYDGGFLNFSFINQFSFLNSDTIWGVGGRIAYPNTSLKGLIYRTTNGGQNWLFQLPDTGLGNGQYLKVKFINRSIGWAYNQNGIHTTNGGDPLWITGIEQISSQVPTDYKLFQNYPNPFNPITNIKYCVKRETSDVRLIVYDLQGKHIAELVNQKNQSAGTYEVDFGGIGYSSGVYFYSLIVEGKLIDTKKMIMLK